MKKVITLIAIAAILVGCKGKGTRVQISDSVDKFKVEKLFVVDSITVSKSAVGTCNTIFRSSAEGFPPI